MESQFGEKIRALREKQHLYLRQVAPLLEMDTAQLSKIEKGLRQLKREQIPIIAEILKASSDELMTLWLADQIYAVVKDEKLVITPLAYTECIYVIMEQLLTNNGAPRLLVQIGGRAHTLIIVECIDTIVGAA